MTAIISIAKKNISALFFTASIILSFILYSGTISGEFVYDDFYFTGRSELRNADQLLKVWSEPLLPYNLTTSLFRPLTTFSFNLNFVLFGESPVSFHIVNILLNGLTTFVIFLVSKKLFGSLTLALFISLFFAFLPIHTEAVANIKGREEVLAALFALLSWLYFVFATEAKAKRPHFNIICSVVFYMLAVLSKEFMVVLPALLFGHYFVTQKPDLGEILKKGVIYAIALGLLILWRYQILGEYAFGKDILPFVINPLAYVDYPTRFWTAFKLAFFYVSKTFVPWNLSATYHYNHLTLIKNPLTSLYFFAGFATLSSLIFLACWPKSQKSALGIGAVTFLASYLVFSKFVFKGGDIFAERWMYFPSVGLSFIAGYLFYILFKHSRWLGATLFMLVLISYSSVLIPRNKVWASKFKLYESMVNTAPKSIQGYQTLSQTYLDSGNISEAKKYSEIGYAIDQKFIHLLHTRGAIAFEEGNYKLAKEMFLREIEVAPHLVTGYQDVAKVHFALGEYEKALEVLEYLINAWSQPREEDFVDYALVLSKLKRYDESMAVIEKRFGDDTSRSRVKLVLAINYFKKGQLEEARKYFDWDTTKTVEEKIRILKEF